MATIPNYTVNTSMPTAASRQIDPSARGYSIGKQMGEIGTAIGTMATAQKSADDKKKIDDYVMAYNNKNDTSIFGGMEGSLRTEKLARLLLPLDQELSKDYALKANKQKSDETQLARNKEVMQAGANVATENIDPDELQAQRFDAMAKAYGNYDVDKSLELQQKSQQSREKKSASDQKKLDLQVAMKEFSNAQEAWSANKDDVALKNAVDKTWGIASTLGAKIQNPVDDYLREKQIAASQSLESEKFKYQKEMDAKELELSMKKLSQDNAQFYAGLSDRAKARMAEKSEGAIKNADRVASYQQALGALKALRVEYNKAKSSVLARAATYVPGSTFQNQSDMLVDGWSKAMSGAATGQNEERMYKRMGDPGFFNPFAQDFGQKLDQVEAIINDKMKTLSQGGGAVDKKDNAPTATGRIKIGG